MAGDWIPITTDLIRRREVGIISQQLGRPPQEVAGFLLEFWGWASGESDDGRIRGYSVATTCATLGHPAAFYHALLSENVGWLAQENGDLLITNWERWLSNSAKARLGKSLDQKIRRAKKAQEVATNVATKLLPEDRTGEGELLRSSLRPVDVAEKDVGVGGGAFGIGPPPQTGRKEADGKEIDWPEVAKTANRFARLGLNKKPQDISLVRKIATMYVQGRIPVDWVESFVETMHGPKKKENPGAYLMGMCNKRAKESGLNFCKLLAETPEPPSCQPR